MNRSVPLLFSALLAFPAAAAAADPAGAFTFAASDKETLTVEEMDALKGSQDLTVRANGTAARHLYVYHRLPDNNPTVAVELDAGDKLKLRTEVKLTTPKAWKRVTFAKPAAPAPTTPPPAVPPAPTGTPAPPPDPPGTLLKYQPSDKPEEAGFPITVRLYEKKDGKDVPFEAGKYDLRTAIKIAGPKGFLTAVGSKFDPRVNPLQVSLGFKLTDGASDQLLPAALHLTFPKYDGAKTVTRDGVYQRTITREEKAATLTGAAAGSTTTFPAHVSVDGYERAFVFDINPNEPGETAVPPVTTPAVRVVTVADWRTKRAASKPVAAYPIRFEVDNAPADARLEVRVQRASDTSDASERILSGPPRDEKVWLDVSDQGFAFATRSTDWVKVLDLTDLRGKLNVIAVLKSKELPEPEKATLTLTVDATPPEVLDVTLPALKKGEREVKLVKGEPLKVSASVIDADTRVTKAVFFIGQPLEDGKLPPDAIKADGKAKVIVTKDKAGKVKDTREDDTVWEAAFQFPADKRGDVSIGVTITDEAGLTTTQKDAIVVKLVDAPPPTGGIKGKVMFGEQPQPGQTVTLLAPDGKVKDTAKTDAKGVFEFKKLLPGPYKLTVAKTDTTTGLSGSAETTVEAGEKPATVEIGLKKNRPGK